MVEFAIIYLILLGLVIFLSGILIGWIISSHERLKTDGKLKTLVALVITIGWITATVSGILLASYTVSPLIHALMGAIVGYFFTDDGVSFNIGRQR